MHDTASTETQTLLSSKFLLSSADPNTRATLEETSNRFDVGLVPQRPSDTEIADTREAGMEPWHREVVEVYAHNSDMLACATDPSSLLTVEIRLSHNPSN